MLFFEFTILAILLFSQPGDSLLCALLVTSGTRLLHCLLYRAIKITDIGQCQCGEIVGRDILSDKHIETNYDHIVFGGSKYSLSLKL